MCFFFFSIKLQLKKRKHSPTIILHSNLLTKFYKIGGVDNDVLISLPRKYFFIATGRTYIVGVLSTTIAIFSTKYSLMLISSNRVKVPGISILEPIYSIIIANASSIRASL